MTEGFGRPGADERPDDETQVIPVVGARPSADPAHGDPAAPPADEHPEHPEPAEEPLPPYLQDQPADAYDTGDTSDTGDPHESADPAESPEPTEPTELIEPAEPAEPVEPAAAAEADQAPVIIEPLAAAQPSATTEAIRADRAAEPGAHTEHDAATSGGPRTDDDTEMMAAIPTPSASKRAPARKKRRGRRIGITVAVVVFLLAGAYLGAAWYFSDRVPANTTVAGVDISSMARTDAIDTLTDSLAETVAAPIPVVLGQPDDSEATAQSEDMEERAGEVASEPFSLDAEATVDSLVGFTLSPGRLIDHLTGAGAVEPVTEVDAEALEDAIEALAPNLQVPPVEGVIKLADGDSDVTRPEPGIDVDVPAAADLLASEWLTGQRPFTLPSVSVPPEIGTEEVDRALEEIVDPLLSGDVTVHLADEATVEFTPADLTSIAHVVVEGDDLALTLDEEPLADLVSERAPSIGRSAQDARIELADGKPRVVPSKTGAGVDSAELVKLTRQAALATGADREVTLDLATTEPEFTTEDAEKLQVKERVSHFTTPVPYNPTRTKNLVQGAKNINGTLIKPGETFSLIDALGPIDAAHGFVASGVVDGGFATTAMGGGLSQISTTMFNAAYEAGMEDVFHKPHSRYFSRYPEGREATMFAPSLDMKWKNNTPYGVLVQAWIGDGKTNVALWSTDYWDVQISTGPRTRITAPTTVYNTAPDCSPESGGQNGFSVHISRTVSRGGERNEQYSGSYTHTYSPWNKVVCGSKPDPKDG